LSIIRVISTLEKIKTEASEIMKKVEETDIVLNEVEKVSHEYLPMAKACSSIFFTLSSLSTVSETFPDKKTYHSIDSSNRFIFSINIR
jgi:dynein heavy chain 1